MHFDIVENSGASSDNAVALRSHSGPFLGQFDGMINGDGSDDDDGAPRHERHRKSRKAADTAAANRDSAVSIVHVSPYISGDEGGRPGDVGIGGVAGGGTGVGSSSANVPVPSIGIGARASVGAAAPPYGVSLNTPRSRRGGGGSGASSPAHRPSSPVPGLRVSTSPRPITPGGSTARDESLEDESVADNGMSRGWCTTRTGPRRLFVPTCAGV